MTLSYPQGAWNILASQAGVAAQRIIGAAAAQCTAFQPLQYCSSSHKMDGRPSFMMGPMYGRLSTAPALVVNKDCSHTKEPTNDAIAAQAHAKNSQVDCNQ